ncbi:MAG TPA: helix-turn-helix domain-containing protein [Micromonosporaceae bacterium]|nr:helix-turn-helix domain-containing protein [Micromonosporaceae bacterium]
MSDRQGSGAEGRGAATQPIENLGARLKRARQESGLALREVARQLGVSASFVSQMENGKSTPSVATLYSMAQLLDVSIDELFSGEHQDGARAHSPAVRDHGPAPDGAAEPISRSALGSPADAWPHDQVRPRISVTRPGGRKRLEMDTGVIWEQLATNTGADLDFMYIFYPPHSTSTNDKRMLQHAGSEFGYLLEGELEVTVGFEVVILRDGDAIGFDSSTPHLLTNKTDKPARGIWFVRHPHS